MMCVSEGQDNTQIENDSSVLVTGVGSVASSL